SLLWSPDKYEFVASTWRGNPSRLDNRYYERETFIFVWISPRPISICQLHVSPRSHLRPIYLVIFKGSYSDKMSDGKSHLEGGFMLRCFPHLSPPHVATQRCSWRNNWYTSGVSIPVLSY